jgi:hypothetical protein
VFLELENKPENEWSRYEKRRMRKLLEQLSSQKPSRGRHCA